MSETTRNLLPLWDYGWCDHARISLARCHSPEDVIREYLHSPAFGTSFVGPADVATIPEIHGPFPRATLSEADFELITPQRFWQEVSAIRQPEGFTSAASDEQWQAVQQLASEVSGGSAWLFILRLTEKDSSRFHEWGGVLFIFREFLCASPDTGFVERLVFGYD
jgi:hypothetical protein